LSIVVEAECYKNQQIETFRRFEDIPLNPYFGAGNFSLENIVFNILLLLGSK